MSDETLSQSEIDALLSGTPVEEPSPASALPNPSQSSEGIPMSSGGTGPAVAQAREPPRESVSLGELLQGSSTTQQISSKSEIHGVKFQRLGTETTGEGVERNIGLLLDVPIRLTAALGSTDMLVKEVLELGRGSIIELDKIAGEPVDLKVNDKLIAKGEVVVINEKFGVRITDIITPLSRIA